VGVLTIVFLLGCTAVLCAYMRPIVTDRVLWSVDRSVTVLSSAKMAEPNEMLFGLWARIGSRNHLLDRGPYPHGKEQFLGGKGRPIVQHRDLPA